MMTTPLREYGETGYDSPNPFLERFFSPMPRDIFPLRATTVLLLTVLRPSGSATYCAHNSPYTNRELLVVAVMGLLTVGKPHSWEHASDHRGYVRHHGVVQFLNTYNRVKDITNDELLWGDEVRK